MERLTSKQDASDVLISCCIVWRVCSLEPFGGNNLWKFESLKLRAPGPSPEPARDR